MNYVCKLLLNSLYGRFAMKPILSKSQFFNVNEEINISNKDILDIQNITEDVDLITFSLKKEGEVQTDIDIYSINSIGIASAVAAYGRVIMSQFKNNPLFKLFYTDTDSAYIEGKLPDNLVGTELGKFKLENSYSKIIFLAPKVYAGCT